VVATPIYDAPVINQTIIIQHQGPSKSAGLAAVLSFIYPGLGQFYNGQFIKGLLFVFLWPIAALLAFYVALGFSFASVLFATQGTTEAVRAGGALGTILSVFVVIFALCVWVWPIVDAYRSAEKINRKRARRSKRYAYNYCR